MLRLNFLKILSLLFFFNLSLASFADSKQAQPQEQLSEEAQQNCNNTIDACCSCAKTCCYCCGAVFCCSSNYIFGTCCCLAAYCCQVGAEELACTTLEGEKNEHMKR